MINVLGADHSGYVKRLEAAVKAVSGGKADVDVKIMQLVRLLRNGEPFKMSKRSGDLVTARRRRRGSRPRRRPASCCSSGGTTRRSISTSPRSRSRPGTIRCSTCSTRTPGPARYSAPPSATCRTLDVSPEALARSQDRAALDARRTRADPARSRSGRGSSRRPRRRTSRTASRSISTTSRRPSTASGPRATRTPRYALLIAEDPKLTLARLALVAAVRQVLVNGLSILGVSAPEELS